MYIIGLLLTIALLLTGVCSKSKCDELWNYWKEENVCIGVFAPRLMWREARQFCQAMTGDLVQIWSEDKLEFVEIVRHYRMCPQMTSSTSCANQTGYRVPHWIGAANTDGDDTIEMINGTKMLTAFWNSGLGHWNNNMNDSTLDGCVALLQAHDGWLGSPCTERYRPICEIKLDKSNTDYDNQTSCTLVDCPCESEEWIPLKHTQKYVKVVKVGRTRSHAAKLCERLGGQLLTVRDEETDLFLKDLKGLRRPLGAFYWLGLIKDGTAWSWNGEEMLKFHHYQNWYDILTPESYKCVAVAWHYDARWRKTDCHGKNFYICETTDALPCRSSPILKTGDDTNDTESSTTNSSSLTLTVNDDLFVQCFSQGYVTHLTKLSFQCLGHTRRAVAGAVLALRYFPIRFESHNKICSCRVVHQDGYAEEIHITIYVKGPPQFEKRSESSLNQLVDEGKLSTVLKFQIMANPKPYAAHLKRLETGTDIADFDVSYHQMDRPLFYEGSLTIPVNYIGDKDTYQLLIYNGFGIGFRINFTLYRSSTMSAPPGGLPVPVSLYTLLGALLLFFIVQFALVCYLWRVKSRKSRKKSRHHSHSKQSRRSDDYRSDDYVQPELEGLATEKDENDKSSSTTSDASSSSFFEPPKMAVFRESMHAVQDYRQKARFSSGTSV